MTKKISGTKVDRIISLHLQGYNQTAISKMLRVDQSTISKYIGVFKAVADQKGLEAALLEFRVQDDPQEIQKVVEEFRKSNLTIADIQVALQIEKLLRQGNIKREDYQDFIQVCGKTKDAGYVGAAIELSKLENETGMSCRQIVAKAEEKNRQLTKSRRELDKINGALKISKQELGAVEQDKRRLSDDLRELQQQIGGDRRRLGKVETLAATVKKAAIADEELTQYIEIQKSLNRAGLSIHTFNSIVEKAEVATEADGGKLLLGMLVEFHGLARTIEVQQTKKQQFEAAIADLQEKMQLRNALTSETNNLLLERARGEISLSQILEDKSRLERNLSQLERQNKISAELKAQLDDAVLRLLTTKDSLEDEIKTKKEMVSDLDERKSERDQVMLQLNEVQTKIKDAGKRWGVFEWFLGMVQTKSRHELSRLVRQLPELLLEEIDRGKYPVDFFQSFLLEQFAGSNLRVMKCTHCGARFMVDKPASAGGYSCPRMCGGTSFRIVVDKDASTLLNKSLSEPKPRPATTSAIEVKHEPGIKGNNQTVKIVEDDRKEDSGSRIR